MKRKSSTTLIAALLSLGLLSGCNAPAPSDPTPSPSTSSPQITETLSEFDALTEEARGTSVTFYGWGGDEVRNQFLQTTVAEALKEKYDITLEIVGMDIEAILAKLSGEKQAGQDSGTIDVIWINGENFYSCKENDLLYGPFTHELPNFAAYIDQEDPETLADFCYPIEGYEAPYGKAQMVVINDSAVTPETPASTQELLSFVQQYPGRVTYPAPPDFTGSAFVRNIIYDICGWEQFMDMEADKETVRSAVAPAMEYLRSLNPYLWNEGKTFPATSPQLTNLYADGEVVLDMSYSPYSPAVNIENGTYSATSRAFLFDKGTIGNTNYMAIAYNSPNKAGAMVVINEMLSAEIQAAQFAAQKTLPVVDDSKLSTAERALFDQVDIGAGTLTQDELLAHRLPEMPAKLVPIIEEIWAEEVVGQ